jgi:acetyltransferase-like isoleucine patch superfamily enzyme
VRNLGFIAIGDDVHLKSVPVVTHLVTGTNGRLRIGNGVHIAHGVSIAAHLDVTIEAGARIGPFVMILDTDFHRVDSRDSAGGSAAIRIGAGAQLGTRVTVLRGSSIGAGAFIEAGSVVKGEIAAHSRASGVPARTGTSYEPEASRPSLERILEIVARTFGLAAPPQANSPIEAIEAWDSVGSLNLLLSLEEVFGVTLSRGDMSTLQRVEDLLPVIEKARSSSS